MSEAIDRWNALAVDAAVRVARRTQTVSTIEVAIVQAAVYNAVNAVEQVPYEPFGAPLAAPPWASAETAVARAAHDVLVWLYPAQTAELDAQLAVSRVAVADTVAREGGENAGAAAARAIIARRTNDGREAPVDFVPRIGPGAWLPTPPAFLPAQTPWVARMKPLAIPAASDLRPGPPPSLGSATYADALNEVRTRGARIGSTRTAAETAQALFWSDDFTTLYNRYLRALASGQRVAGANRARLFAMVNMAAADGLIACMDAKYAYSFWRPVTAIAAADADGNPRTGGDPEWQPLLTTPNHPEYPSAHSCGSQAIATTLAAFFATDRVRSTVESTVEGAGSPRTFERFSDLYDDVDASRIFGGLHYRFSMTAGRGIGLRAARYLVRHHFRRNTHRVARRQKSITGTDADRGDQLSTRSRPRASYR